MRRNPVIAHPDLWPWHIRHALGDPEVAWPFSFGEGWRGVVEALLEELERIATAEGEPIHVRDLRERFGGLRVYVDRRSDAIWIAMVQAAHDSGRTCEGCGAPSRIRKHARWYTTLCDDCLALRR